MNKTDGKIEVFVIFGVDIGSTIGIPVYINRLLKAVFNNINRIIRQWSVERPVNSEQNKAGKKDKKEKPELCK